MFRALLWKEWRQLRMLRWVGAALLMLMPPFVILMAEMATKGWLPSGGASSYTAEGLILDAAPFVMGGALVLFASMFAAQAFAGDRATGTESFLLERPVTRSRTWWSRIVSASGSTLILCLLGFLAWALYASIVATPEVEHWESAAVIIGTAAACAVVLFLGTIAAASVVSSPMLALLVGLILAAVPAGLSFLLGAMFPFALLPLDGTPFDGWLPIGFLVPVLLLPGFGLVSYLICCRGEPAGRGRLIRGGVAFVGAIVAVVVLFLVFAPIVIRAPARSVRYGAFSIPAPSGGHTFFATGLSGWVVELGTTQRREFVGPWVQDAAWSADGEWLAIVAEGGTLGSIGDGLHVRFYHRESNRVSNTVFFPAEFTWIRSMAWAGDDLIIAAVGETLGLFALSPVRNDLQPIDAAGRFGEFSRGDATLIGPTSDGRIFVTDHMRWVIDENGREFQTLESTRFGIFELDLARMRVSDETILEDHASHLVVATRLSPSGRYWVAGRGEDMSPFGSGDAVSLVIVNLATGEETAIAGPHARNGRFNDAWLSGDRLAWVETHDDHARLMLWQPGAEPVALREWAASEHAWSILEASPDRSRLLLINRRRPEVPAEEGNELGTTETRVVIDLAAVYEPAAGVWTELQGEARAESSYRYWSHSFTSLWAGPETVAWTGEGFIALEDVDDPGNLRYVLGAP